MCSVQALLPPTSRHCHAASFRNQEVKFASAMLEQRIGQTSCPAGTSENANCYSGHCHIHKQDGRWHPADLVTDNSGAKVDLTSLLATSNISRDGPESSHKSLASTFRDRTERALMPKSCSLKRRKRSNSLHPLPQYLAELEADAPPPPMSRKS